MKPHYQQYWPCKWIVYSCLQVARAVSSGQHGKTFDRLLFTDFSLDFTTLQCHYLRQPQNVYCYQIVCNNWHVCSEIILIFTFYLPSSPLICSSLSWHNSQKKYQLAGQMSTSTGLNSVPCPICAKSGEVNDRLGFIPIHLKKIYKIMKLCLIP